MTTIAWLRRLYASVFWADDRALESPGPEDRDARRYLHHLLVAEQVWLLRLRGASSAGIELWPQLTDERARALADENRAGYERLLANLADVDLARPVEYANQSGRRFSTATGDILLHVALHGAYHRGQFARALREGGGAPPNTDHITFAREEDAIPFRVP